MHRPCQVVAVRQVEAEVHQPLALFLQSAWPKLVLEQVWVRLQGQGAHSSPQALYCSAVPQERRK